MKKGNLRKSLKEFQKRVDQSYELISKVNNNTAQTSLNQFQIEQITELAFLKIFISWEDFLEDVFIRLSLISKNHPRIRSYIRPKNYSHAKELLKGNERFADWTSVDNVISKARNIFLNGFPISKNLLLIRTELIDMRKIRNKIVHSSQESEEKFEEVVYSKIGYIQKNYTPGKFLLENSTNSMTYLTSYGKNLKTVAEKICELK